jgi:NADPH:quinone reductase-like Zn-dependent oxidoreductase
MDTMLIGRYHVDTRKFVVEQAPVPLPGPGEVLVEVKAAGGCLSDVHLSDETLSPPFLTSDAVTVVHEVSGVIHTLSLVLQRGLTVGTRGPGRLPAWPQRLPDSLWATAPRRRASSNWCGLPPAAASTWAPQSPTTSRTDAREAVIRPENKIGDPIRLILVP